MSITTRKHTLVERASWDRVAAMSSVASASELTPNLEEREVQTLGNARRNDRPAHRVRAVKRSMTLELGALGRETLEEQAGAHRLSVSALLRHSALYYLSERDAGRLAWRVPRFARAAAGGDHEGRLEVALELDDDLWHSLEAESERQRVPLDQLLVHAAFYFMNDLACRRVARESLERM